MIGARRAPITLGALITWTAIALNCTEVHHDLVNDPVHHDAGTSTGPTDHDANTLPPPAAHDAGMTTEPEPARDAAAAVRCGKHDCACDNGIDDDHDGLVDGLDPECTAAFDDDEASFATGLAIKTGNCRDCFWDNNAGFGDDGCRYPAECLTGAEPNGNGNCSSCDVSSACIASCQGRTPNGCDCFGCCEVARSTGEHVFIELRDECSLVQLDDLERCPRCVQNTACANPCGRCELCLGKTPDMLPADCKSDAGGPAYHCDDGLGTCRTSADCQSLDYCQLGCCLVDLL